MRPLIRGVVEDDRKFILNSWLKSFKHSYYAGTIPDDLYWSVYSDTIQRILDSDDSEVLIACDPKAEKIIWGYLICERGFTKPVVHWVYIKQPFRGFGIARDLVNASIVKDGGSMYTFRVSDCRALCSAEGLFKGAQFSQAPVRRKKNV